MQLLQRRATHLKYRCSLALLTSTFLFPVSERVLENQNHDYNRAGKRKGTGLKQKDW